MTRPEISDIVADWWQFAAFVTGTAVAFLIGRERQRFKVDQIGRDVDAQGKRIAALEAQGNAEAVQLAEIVVTQGHILTALEDIKETLRGKADK